MKNLKTLSAILWFSLFTLSLSGQVQVTLTIPNLGSPYLSDYIGRESNRVLILTNTSGQAQRLFLRGKIEQVSAPGYYLQTKENFRPSIPISLAPFETKTLFASSQDWAFIGEGNLEDNLPAPEKRRIQATGILPEGDYQICIQAFDFASEAPLSPAEPAGCQFFMVSLGSPPQIILPSCGETVEQEYPLISWTPAIILQSMPDLVYDLYVVELTSRALNPQEVMEQSILYRGGNPFVVENLRQTFYQYLPGDPPMNPGSRYAMCVVARGRAGTAMFENNGRSEICIFTTPESQSRPPVTAINNNTIVSIEEHPGTFQMHQISKLSGKLLYRFYGDGNNLNFQEQLQGNFQVMQLQPGNSLQNQGLPAGNNNGGGTQFAAYQSMSPAQFNNNMFQQPPPPQYILPAGYNLNGGKPLKQAKIKFTARYAVGKKLNIQHPEDLTLISGMGYPVRVTGGDLEQMTAFDEPTKVIAATTTDNSGNYSVSFYADETFGVITTGPVDVQWGGGEFPAGVSGYGFFRVITMEVEEKWYCHPDVVMFLQPGQSLDVPTQVVTVQSYDVRFSVKANDKALQYAGTGGPIRDAIVKIGRSQYLYEQKPACFPKDEIKINEYGDLLIGSPIKNVMTADTGMTDVNGQITFRRLVKHDGLGGCGNLFGGNNWPTDVYYVEAQSHPTIGDLNYFIERKKQFAPCNARLPGPCPANDCAMRSADYVPPLIDYEIVLLPLFPKILAYSQGIFNNVPYPLAEVNLMMLVWHQNGDFRLTSYQTDANGHFTKQFNTGDMPDFLRTNSAGEVTPQYAMDYFKSGFKRNQCNNCGSFENRITLQFGQKWDLDIFMEPKSHVKGVVEDEHGQPIYGSVKIGDGPFTDLQMKYVVSQGIDAGQAGQPFYLPEGLQVQFQQGQLQQGQGQGPPPGQFQQQGQLQVQQQGLPSGQGPQIVQQGGMTIEHQAIEGMISGNFDQISVFNQPAQSGQQVPLIIVPDASNYFPDTFYVNIPSSFAGDAYDLGKFVIKEKLHRPRIVVYQKVFQINPNTLEGQYFNAPMEGAEVTLSNLQKKTTPASGTVNWVFGSPSNEFRLRINKDGYIPYDQYIVIPPSKEEFLIEIVMENGKVVQGKVTSAQGGAPIEDARIYTEIGSNNYGPIVIETTTDDQGNYVLNGLPSDILEIQATKGDADVTYIGQTKTVNTVTTTTVNFQLSEAPFNLSEIWNLPVAITSVTPSGNNWKVNGAFIDLPHNAHFKPEDETQRLGFQNVTVHTTGPPGPNGKPPVAPTASSITTKSPQFRSILNNTFLVEMTGPGSGGMGAYYVYDNNYAPVYIHNIRVDKGGNDNGLVKARVFSLLEYFRTTYNYDGQFYLGESSDDIVMSPYKGTGNTMMPEKYFLMGYNQTTHTVVNPSFTVHNFDAYTERTESYVHMDSFVLAAKLIVDLPLSNPDKLIVSTGDVIILPDKIVVNEGNQPLEFDLETWHVQTGNWHFDQYQGGLVTSGIITTTLLELPAPNIVIKPNSLKLPPGDQINLNQISLGGIVDMDMLPGAKLTFDYIASPSHDPAHGHWRIVLSNQQQNQNVADIGGLPGWPAQSKIDVRFIQNFSDGFQQLDIAANQKVNHYNVIEQTISNIYLYDNGVAMAGQTDLGIPNSVKGNASFVYYKEQNQTKVRVQGLYTIIETNGQVRFQGDQQPERLYLNWDHMELTGGATIYDDQSANEIHLRSKLMKKPGDIRIKIILVDGNGVLEGTNEQIISLGGGQNGVNKVLQGEQLVVQGAWDDLVYQAQFIGFGGGFQDGQDKMWFRVMGALINDPTKNDEVELANIETPFGDFSLTLVFSEMAIVGNLNMQNITMGAVTVIEGAVNMRMGGLGFYLAANITAIYPVIGQLTTNFIVGSYPHIAPDAQQILKTGMYIQPLPDFLLQSGIQGLYICANKPMFNVDWEVDLLVFGIGIYAEAGIDARFWLNFGSEYGAAHLGGLGYAAFELYVNVLGICDLCVGLLAELGFEAEYQWVPSTSFDISICGTIGFNVDFCGTGFDETAKLEVGWNSESSDIYYDAQLGASCSGNADQGGSGCSHF